MDVRMVDGHAAITPKSNGNESRHTSEIPERIIVEQKVRGLVVRIGVIFELTSVGFTPHIRSKWRSKLLIVRSIPIDTLPSMKTPIQTTINRREKKGGVLQLLL